MDGWTDGTFIKALYKEPKLFSMRSRNCLILVGMFVSIFCFVFKGVKIKIYIARGQKINPLPRIYPTSENVFFFLHQRVRQKNPTHLLTLSARLLQIPHDQLGSLTDAVSTAIRPAL